MTHFLICAVLLHFPCAYAAAENPEHLIVFGDSYSDNGNVFKLTKGSYPNAKRYWHGRFSNGLVWAEYLAKNFNIDPSNPEDFMDFAYGQAKVLHPSSIMITGKTNKTYAIPNLSQEIDSYANTYQNFSKDDLVVVFISSNDFFDQPALNDPSFFKNLADQEAQDIERLINLGAKHIIVLNGRDVTQSRLALNDANNNASSRTNAAINKYLNTFRNMIGIYNQELAKDLETKPSVFLYNTFGFDDLVFAKMAHASFIYTMNGKTYTLRHTKDSCYQNNHGNYQGIAGPVCQNPENYFFYDRIHTATNVNYLLAQDVYKQYMSILSTK